MRLLSLNCFISVTIPYPDKTAPFLKNTSLWKGTVRWRGTSPIPRRLSSYWWLDLVLLGFVDLATSWPGSERHLPIVCLSTEVLLLPQAQGFLLVLPRRPKSTIIFVQRPVNTGHTCWHWGLCLSQPLPRQLRSDHYDEETFFKKWHPDSEDGSIRKMFAQQA